MGIHLIDNFNLFREHNDLSKGKGLHLNGCGHLRHQTTSCPSAKRLLHSESSMTVPPPLPPFPSESSVSPIAPVSPLRFTSHMKDLVKSGIKMIPFTPRHGCRHHPCTHQHHPGAPAPLQHSPNFFD